ncbi:MAG: DUF3570 domain-containing protein [Nitrospirota bacterium]
MPTVNRTGRLLSSGTLLFLTTILFLSPAPAFAQSVPQAQLVIKYSYFSDNQSIFFGASEGNTTPQTLVTYKQGVTERVEVNAHYGVDGVTSATWRVDGVTGATPATQWEYRHEGGLGATYTSGVNVFGISGGVSREPNYNSDFATLSVQREFFERNTTLGLAYTINRDEIDTLKIADTRPFPQDVSLDAVVVTVAQVLSPKMVAQGNVYWARQQGYLAHPENIVTNSDGTWSEEVHPTERQRAAMVGRLIRYFESRSALHTHYRYYRDTWGISSHTAGASWYQYFGDFWVGRLEYRWYDQSGADFWVVSPDPAAGFKTIDGKLRPFRAHLYGIKVSTSAWQLPWFDRTEFNAKIDAYEQRPGLNAKVIEVGLMTRF